MLNLCTIRFQRPLLEKLIRPLKWLGLEHPKSDKDSLTPLVALPSISTDCSLQNQADLALADLLIFTSVPLMEGREVLNQLSSNDWDLLRCAKQAFSERGSLYRFAVEKTNTEMKTLQEMGLSYQSWNNLIVSWSALQIDCPINLLKTIIKDKFRFHARKIDGDQGNLSVQPVSFLG